MREITKNGLTYLVFDEDDFGIVAPGEVPEGEAPVTLLTPDEEHWPENPTAAQAMVMAIFLYSQIDPEWTDKAVKWLNARMAAEVGSNGKAGKKTQADVVTDTASEGEADKG